MSCSFTHSHVVEEAGEKTENSSSHTCKEQQLCVEEAPDEPDELPPRLLFAASVWRAQSERDGQSVCDGVDLHMDREAVEKRCRCETAAWRRQKGEKSEQGDFYLFI